MTATFEPIKSKNNPYIKGLTFEKIAANYLQTKGLFILQHNFRCKFGEIDLICKHQNELIFVEVRYRKNSLYGRPEETINFIKQQKILSAAQHFLTKHEWTANIPCRIDVVAITNNNTKLNIEWIQNAIYM